MAAFDLSRYGRMLTEGMPRDPILTITDHRGIRLFRHPGFETYVGKADNPERFRTMVGGRASGVVAYERDSERRLAAYRRLSLREGEQPYLFIRLSVSEERALAGARSVLLINLALLGMAFVIAVASALFIGNAVIGRRIGSLVKASRQLAQGDFAVRTGLEHEKDELGELARDGGTIGD
ncbi:MAG: HAMP domain-containing protein [Chitinivibrionia bacterium]|nr:HAMP domain-containing protein [Chitinivibrionia bacterium]